MIKIILFVLEISLYLICVANNPCRIHLYRQMSIVQANNESFQINNTSKQMLLFVSSYTSKFLIFLILHHSAYSHCSSRSHLLFMLKVEGHDTVSKATSKGRLTLVDLAGSERISRSEATGIRLVEAAAINKSLSALGQVSLANSVVH